MKLIHAYTCYSCEEVFSGAPGGKCPVCSSDAVYPVGWFERPAEERTRWLGLINGKRETSEMRRRLDEIKAAGWQKTILQKHVAKLQRPRKVGEQAGGLFTEGMLAPGVVREEKLA